MVVHVFAGDLEKGAHHISSFGCGEFMTDETVCGPCAHAYWRLCSSLIGIVGGVETLGCLTRT
jgi:hypothetical protein